MRWNEFESRYPDLYPAIRELCEEIYHQRLAKAGFSTELCNHCHALRGWYSFPCSDLKRLYRERFVEPLDEEMHRPN